MNTQLNVAASSGSSPSPCWADLSSEDRNTLIGERLGAEPMRQVWLMWHYPFTNLEGVAKVVKKNLGSLTLKLSEAEEWLSEAKKSKKKWAERFDQSSCPTFENSDQVKIVEQVWHIRYSDTPGGGWIVVEAMIKAGFLINIEGDHAGWKITCDDGDPHHGRSSEIADTMAEAACKLALRRLLPNND